MPFLNGQTPVLADDRTMSVEHCIDRYYAFQADFEQLNRWAADELAADGFTLVRDDRSFGPRAIRYERKNNAASGRSGSGWVILYQDMRYQVPLDDGPHAVVGYDEPGWVSVQAYVVEPPTLFGAMLSKIREWLGLEAE